MENKRKRGTVIVLITIFFVAASQAPHLINMQFAGQRKVRRSQAKHVRQELIEQGYLEIDAQIAAGVVDPRSNGDLVEQLKLDVAQTLQEQKVAEDELRTESLVEIIETADAYVPPGWLPLGIARAAEGKLKTGLLACLGMFGLGLISLTISYRSSIRKYTGTEPRKRRKGQVDQSKLKARSISQTDFLFRKLPWASEHVSAVAVSSFRSMMRAPETKMILLMPIVMGLLGLSMVLAKSDLSFPSFIRPWLPIGVITISMFSVTSVLFNQFGWDRDGFRAFVLSPIERYRILVGKNISIAPLALGVCVLLILGVQFFIPQSFLSFLATLVQIPNVYLMYCLLGNIVSIFLPMGIKRGTMQPANPRFLPMLAMMFGMMLGPGFLLLPTIVSLGVPQVLEFAFKWPMGGLYLLFSLVQFGFALWFYRWNIKIQGRWLQQREPKILEAVANIPE